MPAPSPLAGVLITGVTGFIGSEIRHALSELGYAVIGTGRVPHAIKGSQNFEYMACDLSHEKDVKHTLNLAKKKNPQLRILIHCAGKAGVWGKWSEYESANVLSTNFLLKTARTIGIERFIFFSTPSISFDYRDQIAIKEDQMPQRLTSTYAQSKWLAEKSVHAAHQPGFQTLCLRPRGVIGAGDRNWLPRIIDLQLSGRLVQPGKGENLVDFTSIKNLTGFVIKLMTAPTEHWGRAYHLSNGEPVRLWSFVDKVFDKLGMDKRRKKIPSSVAMTMAHLSEAYHRLRDSRDEPALLPLKVAVARYSMTLDISDARTNLGYSTVSSTEEAMDEFVQWWLAKK